jgi:hypothetical protein
MKTIRLEWSKEDAEMMANPSGGLAPILTQAQWQAVVDKFYDLDDDGANSTRDLICTLIDEELASAEGGAARPRTCAIAGMLEAQP